MNSARAFAVVMAVWTVSDLVAQKTDSKLSSLFVASVTFFTGFLTGIFPADLLASSSLLALGGVAVGFIIVHLGTIISLADVARQWRTFLVGVAVVIGIGVFLWVAGGTRGDHRDRGGDHAEDDHRRLLDGDDHLCRGDRPDRLHDRWLSHQIATRSSGASHRASPSETPNAV
ncbi:hypothetical protein [Tessaracoccus flavescens]|uniref:hypothetical protein n=1 Tax=Tessaracoccus flavescens TaxID=399497 RepID=UPI0015D082D1|nr:hypothetical protein [Tessaracoccus flavescens]